jgi:hypothetical protein
MAETCNMHEEMRNEKFLSENLKTINLLEPQSYIGR